MGKAYLNLGSGQRPFKPPWVNFDIQESKWKAETIEKGCLWLDGCRATRLPQGGHRLLLRGVEYDIICLHHVLEHFGCGEADGLIKQCRDNLAEDGSLLIMVPDLRLLAKRWLQGGLDTQLYMTQLYGAFMGDEADRHKWGYDFEALYTYLKKFGFSVVTRFNWRSIPGADIARDWYILGMECVK